MLRPVNLQNRIGAAPAVTRVKGRLVVDSPSVGASFTVRGMKLNKLMLPAVTEAAEYTSTPSVHFPLKVLNSIKEC